MKLAVLFTSLLSQFTKHCTPSTPSTPEVRKTRWDNSPDSHKSKNSARHVSKKLFKGFQLRRDSGQEVQDAHAAYYSPDLEAARALAKAFQSHNDGNLDDETSQTPAAAVISRVPHRPFPIGRKKKQVVRDGQLNGPLPAEEAQAAALAFLLSTSGANYGATPSYDQELSQFNPLPPSSPSSSLTSFSSDDQTSPCRCCAGTCAACGPEHSDVDVDEEDLRAADEVFASFDGAHFPTPSRDVISGVKFNDDRQIYSDENARVLRFFRELEVEGNTRRYQEEEEEEKAEMRWQQEDDRAEYTACVEEERSEKMSRRARVNRCVKKMFGRK